MPDPVSTEPQISHVREQVARQRKPPAPAELLSAPIQREIEAHADAAALADDEYVEPEPADPPFTFYAICQSNPWKKYRVEIGSAEDWWILDQYLFQPQRDQMEIWAESREQATKLYPFEQSADPELAEVIIRDRIARAGPPPTEAQDAMAQVTVDAIEAAMLGEYPAGTMFAPQYHPTLTIEQAAKDFERRYKAATGQLELYGPDGPVTRDTHDPAVADDEQIVITAGPLTEKSRRGIKKMFGLELPPTDVSKGDL
jgi:hypothetical protein